MVAASYQVALHQARLVLDGWPLIHSWVLWLWSNIHSNNHFSSYIMYIHSTHDSSFIYLPQRDRRLSWPRWLVAYQDGLPVSRQSPIQVVTEPDIEHLHVSNGSSLAPSCSTPGLVSTWMGDHLIRCERVINICNKLHDGVDFSFVKAFKRCLQNTDFTTF